MLKNIPCRKSQEEVMAHIDSGGFEERYDFFYLPRDVTPRAITRKFEIKRLRPVRRPQGPPKIQKKQVVKNKFLFMF